MRTSQRASFLQKQVYNITETMDAGFFRENDCESLANLFYQPSIHIVELIPPVVSECDPTRGGINCPAQIFICFIQGTAINPPLFQNVT